MTSNDPLLSRLAEQISRNTKVLVDHLSRNGLPQPSFDPDGPLRTRFENDEAASTARSALIEATKELHVLALGPEETTRFFCFNEIYLLGAMQVLCHFKVPQSVPDAGEIGFSELASRTGLSEALLPRFLRMAAANYYFSELRPGFVCHTPWSRTLAHDEGMQACVWFRYAEMLPAVAKFVDMVKEFPDSPEPQDTAFRLAFGDSFFGYKEKHPEHMLKFGQFVSAFASGETADSADLIAQVFPWERLPEGSLVVDVGGGTGHISAAISREHPHLRFQVQDFADLQEESASLAKHRGVSERVLFTPHNFFDAQPPAARGAAVYFLRNILHDWSDMYCRRILKPIAEAMNPNSRIIISDIIQSQANSLLRTQDARIRALDLTMLSMFNAKERSYEDWERLLASVDSRLRITSVVGQPRMRRDSLIEVQM
ncbi:S-adenosyl-L-methionine-dependent methyltransferase [Podospora aff. communis PSN243]|uniref:S-adenosyl-L-methionine-dependent methyltransferase n=1 Tax=Podospora aff. communis PSN243 TaxID=3040156 RepID=A0AAV9GNI9_9PEZI|nr:S-adenosyl-L-methionine-dependent methyltransferase [Podospora aff. communis PSN243]